MKNRKRKLLKIGILCLMPLLGLLLSISTFAAEPDVTYDDNSLINYADNENFFAYPTDSNVTALGGCTYTFNNVADSRAYFNLPTTRSNYYFSIKGVGVTIPNNLFVVRAYDSGGNTLFNEGINQTDSYYLFQNLTCDRVAIICTQSIQITIQIYIYNVAQLSNLNALLDTTYNIGYNDALSESNPDIFQNGYNSGYQVGYNQGINESIETTGFRTLINSILSYPVNMIKESFNFEFMGVNIASIILFVVSISIVFFVVKKFKE